MLIISGWVLFAFGAVRCLVAFVNWVARSTLPAVNNDANRKVSVLVPVRNEEKNLPRLLENFPAWRNEIFELILYDDLSTDKTLELANRYASADAVINVIEGTELPAGWLGKNHACDVMANRASGDVLLFVDADITLSATTVSRAVGYMERYRLDLLSLFPTQLMDNPGSRLSVPLMNWILLSLLPLPAVRLSRFASLSAANGQFMMFRKDSYDRLSPHSRFRDNPVEDIAISKAFKKNRLRTATLLGGNEVFCRMYSGLSESIAGFTKNITDFFGGSALICLLFTFGTTVAPFLIFIVNDILAGALYVFMIVLLRIFVSLASRQSVWQNVALMLPQQIVLWVIVLQATNPFKTKSLEWKGRKIA